MFGGTTTFGVACAARDAEAAESAGGGAGAAGGSVPEVKDQASLEQHCTGRLGLCVIGLLDPSAQGFAGELQTLEEVGISHQPSYAGRVYASNQASCHTGGMCFA